MRRDVRRVHTVRLAGLQFSKGPGGPAERVTKSAAKAAEAKGKIYYIGRETHYSIEACCDGDDGD